MNLMSEYRGPTCGCSACRQNWIDTGDVRCVNAEPVEASAGDLAPGALIAILAIALAVVAVLL